MCLAYHARSNVKMTLPLEGITVLALEQAVAGPFCTRQLADLGARIIKVERTGGGDFARGYDERARGMSSYFVWLNRSKQSLAMDVKHPHAADILRDLLKGTDVLVQNLAPGATERLGLSYEALKEEFPALIVCDISGFGDGGPYSDKKAYDLLVQSESGFLSVTGTEDVPAKAGISVADISAGMYAYSSILAALVARTRNGGKGCRIHVSLLETMIEWMSQPLYYSYDNAPAPVRCGASHATIQPYGPFPAGDGKAVMLGLQNEREWTRFCIEVLQTPELVGDTRFDTNSKRVAARAELREIITAAFSTLSSEEVTERLDVAGIANARVNDMHDVWAHPQLSARNRWTSVGSPVGPLDVLRPPAFPEGLEAPMGPVPSVGEHSATILAELGWDETGIEALRTEGVIRYTR